MANYQHKRSAVAGKIPLASDLLDGEIAVNIKDRKLFAKDDQGVVFEFLGGNGGAVDTVNNVAPVNGNVTLNALNIPPTSDRLWLTQAERQLIASFDAYDKVESDDRYLLEANNLNDLDDASVARTNLGLGTAATRDVGENSGNVMEVGAFGLGASNGNRIPNDDADSLERTGIYSTPPTWIGSVYSGSSAGNQGTLYHSKSFSSATSYATQIFIPMINVDKMLFRKNNGTIWGAWKEVYHTSNILGTVSQSGGVPTGAIIERGSNVNGEYTKYADGTFEFYRLLPFSNYNGSQGYNFTLPVAAIERPVIIPCYRQSGTNFVTVKDNNIQTNTTTEYEIAFSSASGANGTASVFGYGRWY